LLHHITWEVRPELMGPCSAFYALLGFREVEPPETLRDRTVWLEREGTQIHLMIEDEPATLPKGHVAVIVDDYERTLAALREAGRDPEPRTEHWGSPRAFVRDPAGNRVELMAFPPG
jgi:catechol 2,3-dioxygenase-like lactoylglutathione lyase family enzyme